PSISVHRRPHRREWPGREWGCSGIRLQSVPASPDRKAQEPTGPSSAVILGFKCIPLASGVAVARLTLIVGRKIVQHLEHEVIRARPHCECSAGLRTTLATWLGQLTPLEIAARVPG